MKSLNRAEKRAGIGLLLLCLVPVGVAYLLERQKAARSRSAPINVSPKTLAKYKETVPSQGNGYIRLGDQGWGGGPEGSWDIYVTGHQPRPIEAHRDIPLGWKVEFVEELPAYSPSGVNTIGVRVTVPKGARQAVLNGATAGMFHTRNGVQVYYSESFEVKKPSTHPSQAREHLRHPQKASPAHHADAQVRHGRF